MRKQATVYRYCGGDGGEPSKKESPVPVNTWAEVFNQPYLLGMTVKVSIQPHHPQLAPDALVLNCEDDWVEAIVIYPELLGPLPIERVAQ